MNSCPLCLENQGFQRLFASLSFISAGSLIKTELKSNANALNSAGGGGL